MFWKNHTVIAQVGSGHLMPLDDVAFGEKKEDKKLTIVSLSDCF